MPSKSSRAASWPGSNRRYIAQVTGTPSIWKPEVKVTRWMGFSSSYSSLPMSNDPAGIGRHQGLSSASSSARFAVGRWLSTLSAAPFAARLASSTVPSSTPPATSPRSIRRSTSRTQNRSWPQVVDLATCSNRPTATARSFTKAGISSITFWRAWSCSFSHPAPA
ncbi:MAG: hypothetical protein IPI35_36115 [Deltaproteobacteria bacterium]|nr:hypothetical protein [Deltaproteobacteria bacterium]